jgi:hypothetical protein
VNCRVCAMASREERSAIDASLITIGAMEEPSDSEGLSEGTSPTSRAAPTAREYGGNSAGAVRGEATSRPEILGVRRGSWVGGNRDSPDLHPKPNGGGTALSEIDGKSIM